MGDQVEEKIRKIVGDELEKTTKKEDKMSEGCLDCVRKDNELSTTKLQHQHELEKLQAQVTQSQQQAKSAAEEANDMVKELYAHLDDPGSCHDPANCDLSKKLAEYRRNTLTAQDVGDWLKEKKLLSVIDGKEVKSIEVPGTKGGKR